MWAIEVTDTFDTWLKTLNDTDRTNVLAIMQVLRSLGPQLSRPYADTVYGSCHSNMKELRIQSCRKPLRAFFAFDPKQKGILLCAGNKATGGKRFYEEMIRIADLEFTAHLDKIKKRKGNYSAHNEIYDR